MKDIDFDELDRAVSSLMTPSAGGASAPKAEPAITDEPTAPLEVSVPQEANTNPSQPSPESVVSSTNAVKRSSGRFMDVVHPSSDMRSTTPVGTPARSSGITPPARTKLPSITTSQPVEKVDAHRELPSTPPTEAKEEPATNVSFPDPLDMIQENETEKEALPAITPLQTEAAPVEARTDEEDTPDSDLIASESSDDSSETLESLFLPNVKVEKRPLGAANGADEEVSTEVPTSDGAEDAKKVDTLVTPDPTLAELGDDVLAIESDVSTPADEVKDVSSARPKEVDDTAPVSLTPTNSAISSIPRQYSVKPSSDDKHHEALYDTAAQAGSPLQHPAEKKSGWMVVLWILLLIVVGVGGALALYFFKVF